MSNITPPKIVSKVAHEGNNFKIIYVNADIYIGELNKNGLFEGLGKYVSNGKNYFNGNFKDGKKYGSCVEMWWNIKFEGNYVNNKREGNGLETYEDGSFSHGNYTNDKRNGVFNFTRVNGTEYKISYINGEVAT